MKPIIRILSYLKHFPWHLGINVFFNLLHIVFNLGSYVMIVPFVELLFGLSNVPEAEPAFSMSQEGLTEWAFWHLHQYSDALGLWRCLVIIAGGYLALSLLSNLFRYLALFFLDAVRNGLIEHLRNDLYHRITILPVSYFNKQRRGDLISRMSNDLADIEWSIVSTLQMLVISPINIIVFSATLIFVSWRLFVLFLVVLPGGTERFRASNEDYTRTMVKVARRREISSPLSEILGTLALVIILIVGGSWVIGGHIMPSVFIFFVIIFARLIPPIQSVVKAYNSLQKGSASAVRFLEVLDADEMIMERPNATVLPAFSDSIEFRDTGFHFADGIPILQHIDLRIEKGQTVAIVGPSGAGKSTMVDLLPRFQDITSGDIIVDRHSIKELNIDSLRRQFAIVSQNCILFNDTVANNIAFGSTQYNIESIKAAARVANAADFIEALPQGYDTPVGDRGITLSGGQRQRLSIARAVLRDAPILILDEATSALDSESEQAVQQGLDGLMQGRTCIIIAHRLSTIRHADLIVVVEKGHIVQRGTHDQLIGQEGLYKKLVEMQSFA